MPLLIAAGFFCALAGVISAFGYRHYARRSSLAVLARNTTLPRPASGAPSGPAFTVRTFLASVGEKLPVSPGEAGKTRRLLQAAGRRSDGAFAAFYGLKLVLCLSFGLVAFLFRGTLVSDPSRAMLLVGAAAVIGYVLPAFLLGSAVKRRRTRIRMALPDALDLLVLCMEAGLGLEQSIQKVSEEIKIAHPELASELNLTVLEMHTGTRRATALSNLAERTGEPELKKFIAVLIQTDRFGTSLGDALRAHSDFLRVRRTQEAEERAGKVGVKLIFPIFFFSMPAIFIVSAGPGMLMLFKRLLPLLRNPSF